MGYRSTVVIMHDYLSILEAAPGRFVREMVKAIHEHSVRDKIEHWGGFMGGQVVSVDHADAIELVAIAGYNGQLINAHLARGDLPKTDEEIVNLLRRAAWKYGYTLAKRPKGTPK